MSRIAYVNGRYERFSQAAVHVEDRGFQFADGVYEVCFIHDGRLADEERHLERLGRSLAELRIAWPVSPRALGAIAREVVARNRVRYGMVYMQITRGAARRDHAFPVPEPRPTLVVTARGLDLAKAQARAAAGVAVITVPEIRWARRDIKSVSLLPNVLAKQAAREAGAYEAWFVDERGFVTEGASTNAWIVTAGGVLVTHPRTHDILWGITRSVVLDLAAERQMRVEERPFSVEEAMTAQEAFITAASALVLPVVRLDGRIVGAGTPGPVAKALRAAYPLP